MKEIFADCENKMSKVVSFLEKEYASIRAGRANPSVLDKILVDYYGTPTPINQMAAVSVTEARILVIQPWDVSTVRSVEKAILASELGITPQTDGKVIRLTFPPLTEERRREIVKTVAKMAEEAKVSVRNIRRDGLDKLKALKKEASISEDELRDAEKEMQELTDKYCKNIDKIAEAKEKEILEI